MTIYTDQVTGKKYDRVPGGVAAAGKPPAGYVTCCECAFAAGGSWAPWEPGEECARAVKHCVSATRGKTVFFVFKERTA